MLGCNDPALRSPVLRRATLWAHSRTGDLSALQKEKTTFKLALEDIQKTLARKYLDNSFRSIGEVAYLLGFSEPSSFVRAFKRWNGKTPSQYRS